MDIVSHALAGAATGSVFGRPFLGAFFGVLPDLAITSLRRPDEPTSIYDFTHSGIGAVTFGLAGITFFNSIVPFLAVLSHLFLDLPTHGDKWAPPLLYPYSDKRFSCGEEWEWFNLSWCLGFLLTLTWSAAWFGYASATGSL